MVVNSEMRRMAEEQARLEASMLPECVGGASDHELRVHQIELEMQNEELRRAQEELVISRERYFELYDLAPVAYCTLSGTGLILEANLAVAMMLGVSRKALVNRSITKHIMSEDQDLYYLHRKVLLETGARSGFDLRMVNSQGETLTTHFEMALAENQKGETFHRVVISDITERTRAEDTIKALLAEKELFLKEVHHRIKNTMHTMVSLLSLQATTLQDPATIAVVKDIQSRFSGFELLYDQLYQSDGHASGSVRAYLDRLVERLVGLFPNACNVVTELRIDDIPLEARRLSSLGLIVNELVTNAMKYAFGGNRTGRLSVQVKKHAEKITLTVADDGPGMPAAIQHIMRSPGSPMDAGMTSLGLSIIFVLAQQLDGTIEFAHEGGTTVKLVFPA
jgi:PAS domain S-box-containing protein